MGWSVQYYFDGVVCIDITPCAHAQQRGRVIALSVGMSEYLLCEECRFVCLSVTAAPKG